MTENVIAQFRIFLAKNHHPYNGYIIIDSNKFERFRCPFGKKENKHAAYFLRTNPKTGKHYGYLKCFGGTCGEAHTWVEEGGDHNAEYFSAHEIEELKREQLETSKEREGERQQQYQKMAQFAQAKWDQANDNYWEGVPYVQYKKFNPYGLKKYGDVLYVPLRDVHGHLWNIERIFPNHEKRPLVGCRVNGVFHLIGELDPSGFLYLCEGIATACIVYEATQNATVCCRNADNLIKAAQALKLKYPQIKLKVAADDDRFNLEQTLIRLKTEEKPPVPKHLKNAGIFAGTQIVKEFNAELTVPDFSPIAPDEILTKRLKPPSDFHDVFVHILQRSNRPAALDIVRQQLSINATKGNNIMNTSLTQKASIVYRCVSDIKPKQINWLWHGRIAKGKITMIAGNPGLGKSQLSSNITAIVTQAGKWPVDEFSCEVGGAVILSAEDDPEDTIRPRLEAAGADLEKIYIIDAIQEGDSNEVRRCFNLKKDIGRLDEMVNDLKAKNKPISLVIIDPITAYLGETDSYKNAEVRSLLTPLSEFAAKHQVAVIAISHLNKNGNTDALMRVSGSLAFVAAARAAYLVAQDDEDESKRLLLPLKNNIGNDKTGLSFCIESCQLPNGIETSKIKWLDETVHKTANDVMINYDQNEKDAITEAKEFLTQFLAHGPMPVKSIFKEGEDAGHSKVTLRRAKMALNIEAVKSSMAGCWTWRLPTKVIKIPEDDQDDHTKNMNTFGKNDHLRQNLYSIPGVQITQEDILIRTNKHGS